MTLTRPRISHKRIKPKASAPPTPTEKRHMGRIAGMACLVSGERPVTLHHVSASIHGGRFARSHFLIVPLAARYHLIQYGPRESVEALGHRGFYETYGIDLLAEAERLRDESRRMGVI